MDTLLFALGVALVGGIISLDETAMLQIMISQPLCACTVLGLSSGHPREGMIMGSAFQLLFASDLPVGSHLPRKACLASMGALGAAMVYQHEVPAGQGALPLAAVLAVAAEPLLALPGRLARVVNNLWTPLVLRKIEEGKAGRALLLAHGGIIVFFLEGFLALLLFILCGGWILSRWAGRLPSSAVTAAQWTFSVLPLIGAAHFFGRINAGRLSRYNPISLLHLGKAPR